MEARRPEASVGHILCHGHKTPARTQETIGEAHGKVSTACRAPVVRPSATSMATPMTGRNVLETIRGTYMGCGSQDGSPVPGSAENTSPPHSEDGRRRYPNTLCTGTESEEGASIGEGYLTRIPQHGGLEAHPYRGPAGRHRGLVYFPELHPMAGATDDQSYTVIGSGGVGKKPHIRTS